MSDHIRVLEDIAAAVAGGLTPEESEQLDAHVRDCRECAAALDEARTLDRKLQAMFLPDRPGAALEERAIQTFRVAETRRRLQSGWRRKVAIGVAASVGITITGAGVSLLAGREALPGPADMFAKAARQPSRLFAAEAFTSRQSPAQSFNATESMAISQGLPDVSNVGATSYVDSAGSLPYGTYLGGLSNSNSVPSVGQRSTDGDGGTRYFGTWGASRSAGNSGVFLQVDQNVADGGPSGRPVAPNSPPASPPPAINGPVPPSATSKDAPEDSFNSRKVPPLGYIKPSDLAGKPPSTEQPGSDAKGERKLTPTAPAAVSPPPPPASPAVPALPPVQDGEQGKKDDKPPPAQKDGPPVQLAPPAAPKPPAAEPAAPRKIIIRSGDMEFEVESFDAAVAAVTRLVTAIDGAFVATVNSEKLPNGKVKGSVVLRVPPDRLDSLVLDLRKELGKAGELKGQRIGSQDITKQYTDLESRLKAARTMETRLLQIIKEGKGEIKQLLEVEKELGVWRTRIEEYEGELRYYGNLAALSTLTVTLAEREIRAAVTTTERERVQAGVEVEDVDKALQDALAAVAEAKGRVTKSELKQLAAGQFNATLHCELSPLAAGPFRDRLKQLGRVARLEIDRVLQSEGGTAVRDAKVTRGDTQFLVQFYNLANVAPRETTTALVAVADVPAGFRALREAIEKAHGRVLTSRLEEQDRLNVTAQLDFEVRRVDEPALMEALNAAGEVVSRNVARAADGDNLTDSKMLFRTALVSAVRVRPRETTTLTLEVPDVDATVAVFGALVAEAKGRTADSQSSHERAGRDSARLVYDMPLSAASSLVEKFKAAGAVRAQHSARDLQAPDGRFATARIDVTLANIDPIVAKDDGLWPQVRRGLSFSVTVLLTSVTWIVFGLCVVLPWAVVGYGGYRLFKRLAPSSASPPVAPAPVPPTPPSA
jgi:uncharacterized membrane protein